MIFTAEKSLKDAGDKANPDLKKEVEEKISALKAILDNGVKEDIETKTKDLSDSLQKVGQAMYQQQPGQQPGQEEAKGESTNNAQQSDADGEKKSDKEEPVEGEVVN